MSYSSHDLSDTIVALATPPGVGAIGVIRLSGAKAIAIADEVFYGKKLAQQPSHTIHFGTIRDDSGRVLDEVLASLFVAPASYTGEHVVEFSCHGSSFILQEVLQLLIRKGARLAQPGEFTLRAFLNGRMDLSQAEAVADLIASASQAAHQMALQQMRGGFSQEIQQLRQQLIDFASLVELELDFSEEDVAFANRSDLRQLVERILQVVSDLIRSFQLGNVIKNGVNTVIAGRPNAGKSTLLNALLNEERAIVSEIAGTTRDTIEEVINIQGIPFRLIDTAGIREAQDTIEAIGVERTLEKVRQSSLLLYVFDVAHTPAVEVRADLEKLIQPGTHVLLLANKMDLNPYTDFHSFFSRPSSHSGASESSGQGQEPEIQPNDWIPLIAREGMNVPYLKERLYDAILQEKVNLDSPLVSNARHLEALQKAADSLQRVLDGLDTGISADFVAMDIRAALRYLGEITGEVSTEDLLGNIFSRFCIGK